MKFTVTRERTNTDITWYSYEWQCDKCKSKFRTYMTSEKPDFDELDLCGSCLRELLSDKDRENYQSLKKKLYIPYKAKIIDGIIR